MIDFSKIKTYPIKKRASKSSVKNFSRLEKDIANLIPDILGGDDFKTMISLVERAAKKRKQIILMLGAHVIKCGLSPIIIDLMKRKIITHVAMNGAVSIHDFEIAMIGQTSEDVAAGLKDGSFGMVEETGKFMNDAIKEGAKNNVGMGRTLGEYVADSKFEYEKYSILACGYKFGIPVTVHVAIGTDTIHQHPNCDGASMGKTTYEDFKIFTESVSKLNEGVILNWGSAVIMPETFIKALTIARNLGYDAANFTAVNFDMILQYRALTNVLKRPTLETGMAFNFIGQHELLIPLFYHSLMEKMKNEK
jgi:hypothetical protein